MKQIPIWVSQTPLKKPMPPSSLLENCHHAPSWELVPKHLHVEPSTNPSLLCFQCKAEDIVLTESICLLFTQKNILGRADRQQPSTEQREPWPSAPAMQLAHAVGFCQEDEPGQSSARWALPRAFLDQELGKQQCTSKGLGLCCLKATLVILFSLICSLKGSQGKHLNWSGEKGFLCRKIALWEGFATDRLDYAQNCMMHWQMMQYVKYENSARREDQRLLISLQALELIFRFNLKSLRLRPGRLKKEAPCKGLYHSTLPNFNSVFPERKHGRAQVTGWGWWGFQDQPLPCWWCSIWVCKKLSHGCTDRYIT